MILVSFADARYREHLYRLRRQASRTGLYRRVLILSEHDLPDDFRARHSAILQPQTRGFGYWIWKPQAILQAISVALPGEVVNYLDAGFFINRKGIARLRDYETMAQEFGVLGFKSVPPFGDVLQWDGRSLPVWKNREWTKRLLLERMNLQSDEQFLEDVTFEAGVLFVQNSLPGVKFVREWLALMEENYAFIDDSPSPTGELDDFREHRHDQSCFSALAYRRDIQFVSSREFWYPEPSTGKPNWDANPELPFQARRLKAQKLSANKPADMIYSRLHRFSAGAWRRLRRFLANRH